VRTLPFRSFISVDLPGDPGIAALSRELEASQGQIKLVDPAQLHVTLKFLGTTDEGIVPRISEAMQASVRGLRPFPVRVIGTGAFPSLSRMSVIWVGLVDAEPLGEIASTLARELLPLGFPQEKRPFVAHATLARVRGGRNLDRVREVLEAHRSEPFGRHTVEAIRLKRSVLTPQGPVYSVVAEVPL